LLAEGYPLIFPESTRISLVIGLLLWGLALLWFLIAVCQKKELWGFRGSWIVRVVLIVSSTSLFMWFGWTKYNARPPIIYPWLSYTWMPSEEKARLHIHVRDYSSSSDSYVMSLSSLYNLSMTVSVPIAFMRARTGFKHSSCRVVEFTGVDVWNNQEFSTQPIATINVRDGTTVLLISASSRNARWEGFLAIHKKGNHMWREEQISGWAQVNGSSRKMSVRETYEPSKKIMEFGGDFFHLTPEFLLHYGVPMRNADNQECLELLQ
jgi:hypothetical protein